MPEAYTLHPGSTPLLISMPHNASEIPPELAARMYDYARSSPDTDWFLDRLYAFAPALGIGLLKPTWSRYVIDLNRPQDDASLYPGSDITGLCPLSCFDRRPIYLPGQEPQPAEISQRIENCWQPYHQALNTELERLLAQFGVAVLFEAHSIASRVPRFFAGQLPDLNLGSNDGASCDPSMQQALVEVAIDSGYSWVLNGRFKGGYITRAYARPQAQLHSFQLELSQACYLDEAKQSWDPHLASNIQTVLEHMLKTLLAWSQTRMR
ncbi:MAG: N-formylglutamate deformylase [Candidatus Melainabacteria bacterium HGW-Melainabacteria-1]|nr:MAG: N-formylglutamate deformylase [Candidatus Melainabacteria bacterium HGW-Melainabacteria-1]